MPVRCSVFTELNAEARAVVDNLVVAKLVSKLCFFVVDF